MNSGEPSPQWPPITSGQQIFTFSETYSRLVVYFTAPTCFRCKQIEPKIAGFPTDFPEVHFARVDVDEVVDAGDVLDISILPTCILFHNGTEVHRIEGVPQQRPARALAQALKVHFFTDT